MSTMSGLTYTKDQLKAIKTIVDDRPQYMTLAKQLTYDGHDVALNHTTLLVLKEPVWGDGVEYDVRDLIKNNETLDRVIVHDVSTAQTHYFELKNYCKIAEHAFFDPKVVKRAFRALKYRDEDITLHYTIDQRRQQRYCKCLTFRTDYGYALVMACRIVYENELTEV